MQVSNRKGRPNYDPAYKRLVAIAACESNVSVAKLAQSHGLNPNMVFKWRREYRAGLLSNGGIGATLLIPVTSLSEVSAERPTARMAAANSGTTRQASRLSLMVRAFGSLAGSTGKAGAKDQASLRPTRATERLHSVVIGVCADRFFQTTRGTSTLKIDAAPQTCRREGSPESASTGAVSHRHRLGRREHPCDSPAAYT